MDCCTLDLSAVDPFEHQIEGCNLPQLKIGELNRDFLEHAEHRSLANRTVLRGDNYDGRLSGNYDGR
jgi:hypothetical protein